TPANALSNKLVRIVNIANPNLRINIEKGPSALIKSTMELGAPSGNLFPYRVLPTSGSKTLKPDQRLQVETGQLSTAPIHDGAWSAHWELKLTSTGTYLIKNRGERGKTCISTMENWPLGR
ncbi:MAG: hypothetical protein IPO07_00970, partial [Haliscomenobacter sp.]